MNNIVNFRDKNLDCTLNLTDIKNNNNKFYTLCLLSRDDGNFTLITRYGRVGNKGKESSKIFQTFNEAYYEFRKIFKNKTGNHWEKNFIPIKGKYFLMEIENEEEEILDDGSLNNRISDFLKIISDKKTFLKTYHKIGIDSKKCPLGKINESQIQKSYKILNDIKNNIDVYGGEDFIEKSSEFWTLIPYNTGRNRPPVIDSLEKIKKYSEIIDSIKEIEIGNNILKDNKTYLDIYNSLGCEIYPVQKDSDEYKLIEDYVFINMGGTHYKNYELVDILAIEKDDPLDKNRYETKLLFHGSRISNYLSIIKNGLRIPNTKNVCHGSVLGYGIYFADCSTKSLNYCHLDIGEVGCLLLCEVVFSQSNNTDDVHYTDKATFDVRPEDRYTSRMALGKYSSKNSNEISYLEDVEVPLGKMELDEKVNGGFLYNEYVIYSKHFYRFKYLILVKKV